MARRFLEDLLDQQRGQGLPGSAKHLAKTLAKAATIVRGHGLLDWSREFFQTAMAENSDDAVPASGLADVLKARGELEAAEAQYRDNIDRWPGNRVARNGLANVLRKRGLTVEALRLVPEPQGERFTVQDLYDLHVRAILLMDLGRAEDARNALDRGLFMAKAPATIGAFERTLVMLELRIENYPSARERLAALSDNVVSLQLFRLHAAAADGDEREARYLAAVLRSNRAQMSAEGRQLLSCIEEGFCLVGEHGLCRPGKAELAAIFDAEAEMELAA